MNLNQSYYEQNRQNILNKARKRYLNKTSDLDYKKQRLITRIDRLQATLNNLETQSFSNEISAPNDAPSDNAPSDNAPFDNAPFDNAPSNDVRSNDALSNDNIKKRLRQRVDILEKQYMQLISDVEKLKNKICQ